MEGSGCELFYHHLLEGTNENHGKPQDSQSPY